MPKKLLFYQSHPIKTERPSMRYESLLLQLKRHQEKVRFTSAMDFLKQLPGFFLGWLDKIKFIGFTPAMSAQERIKLGIFNQLNFFQLITGLTVPVFGLLNAERLPSGGWLIVCLPALVSIVVLILNYLRFYQEALMAYFIFYPVFICFSYINGISLGIELSFILYGILSVFFIADIGYMLFSIGFSMVSYFVLTVVLEKFPYQLEEISYAAYLINQILAIVYIFYGLYLIKTENNNYNKALHDTNEEIRRQSVILQEQAEQLDQLNSLQNKLFSIISHDLKAPMYALRNLFTTMEVQKMPANDIREFIPEVQKDLNYTVGLMENLLHWAKSQMKSNSVNLRAIDVCELVEEVVGVLHLQAEEKNISINNKTDEGIIISADRDMISLVIRNILSNAIKFTPPGGRITIGATAMSTFADIFIHDTGKGIAPDDLKKINAQEFFTTNGTSQEQGTGLGLMLCRDFLTRNGGKLRIESEPGNGSRFSFTLPMAELHAL